MYQTRFTAIGVQSLNNSLRVEWRQEAGSLSEIKEAHATHSMLRHVNALDGKVGKPPPAGQWAAAKTSVEIFQGWSSCRLAHVRAPPSVATPCALASSGHGLAQRLLGLRNSTALRGSCFFFKETVMTRFARLLDVDVGTLRNWEQGRRHPTGPARALLGAIKRDPKWVLKALAA
jgi:hypothetical protein